MNFGQMQAELGFIIKDDYLKTLMPGWINAAILDIATDYDLPPLALAEPYVLTVAATDWLWPLPATFHKKLTRATWTDGSGYDHRIHIHKNLVVLRNRNHTTTGDQVSEVTVIPQGNDLSLAVYPLAAQDINLWFYQKPAVLSAPGDVCDCILFNFIPQVIYPKLIIKNYQFIVDMVMDFPVTAGPLQYWQAELRKGLLGASGQGIGLLNFFNLNYNPPRRTGGRDPIGYRPW